MKSRPLEPGEVLPTDEPATPPKRKPKRSASGRFSAINAFVDVGLRDLSRSELATWLVLWRDERDGVSRTSAGAIAQKAGISRRSVVSAMATLRRRGMLVQKHRGGLNRGSSVYRLRPIGKEHVKPTSP